MNNQPPSTRKSEASAQVPCSAVSEAVEFARQHRGDCSNLITFVALRETGMLDAYMKRTIQKYDRKMQMVRSMKAASLNSRQNARCAATAPEAAPPTVAEEDRGS